MADLHNQTEQEIWAIEKLMKDAGDKIGETDKAPVNAAIQKVREASKGTDKDAIQQAISNLQSAAHALAQHIQRMGGGGEAGGSQPGGNVPPGSRPSGGGGKDDVIDAEFEVKK